MKTKMPVISLWQPWASLMALGRKRIETRGYRIPRTLLNKPVAIHAAARRVTKRESDEFAEMSPFRRAFMSLYDEPARKRCMALAMDALPYGAIIAVVEFVGDRKIVEKMPGWGRDGCMFPPDPPENWFGNYEPGRYGWITDPLKLYRLGEPIPARGKQGVWYHDVPYPQNSECAAPASGVTILTETLSER